MLRLLTEMRRMLDDALLPQFRCPFTGDLINEAYVDDDGNSYEGVRINEWYDVHHTSPITGLRMRLPVINRAGNDIEHEMRAVMQNIEPSMPRNLLLARLRGPLLIKWWLKPTDLVFNSEECDKFADSDAWPEQQGRNKCADVIWESCPWLRSKVYTEFTHLVEVTEPQKPIVKSCFTDAMVEGWGHSKTNILQYAMQKYATLHPDSKPNLRQYHQHNLISEWRNFWKEPMPQQQARISVGQRRLINW